MSTSDATFLWETEALRESTRSRLPDAPAEDSMPTTTSPRNEQTNLAADGWVTLRDAYEATGIPVETLRKWARRGSIPSDLDESVKGTRRMVRMDDVTARARELGRDISPVAVALLDVAEPPGTPDDASIPKTPTAVVDLSDGAAQEEDTPPVTVTLDEVTPAAGTMIVPIAAWDKMLMQLGNLHEAGQQLAEARERAAKAETENRFLKERLADMRDQTSTDRPDARTTPVPAGEPVAAPTPSAASEAETQAPPTPTRRLMQSLQRWRIEVRRR